MKTPKVTTVFGYSFESVLAAQQGNGAVRVYGDLSPSYIAKLAERKAHDISRLRHALEDTRNHPVAYPILAKNGMMEQTDNGYKAIDPAQVNVRCIELIAILSR